jgi:CHAT domain-containing protein
VENLCAVAQKVGASEGLFSFADNCTLALRLGSQALKQPFVLDGLNSLLVRQKQSLLTLKGANFHLIGQVYLKQNNYTQALASYRQALPILAKVGSPAKGATLGDMGIIYLLQGQYDLALASSQQAVKISRAFNHRINEEDALYYLAVVYWAQGNVRSALDTLMQKSQVENENLANNLTIGSEEQKRIFVEGKSKSVNMNVGFHLQSAPQNSEAAKLALTTVLQRKGRILDAVSDNVRRLRQNLQPEDRQLFDNLNTFRAALVNLLYDKQNTLSEKEFKTQVVSLKTKINKLEDRLAQRSTEFRGESQPVKIEAVQTLIPTDAALVEFIRYSPFNPKANNISQSWGIPRYAAVILIPKSNPKWIDLGTATEIDRNIQTFREYLQDGSSTDNRQRNQIARTLDQQLMQPIRQYLGDTKHLLLSPDSALNLIPFEALKDENDKYLIERYAFSYLTSGRDLIRFPDSPPSRQVAVVFSEINYDRATQVTQQTPTKTAQARSIDLASTNFSPLQTLGETQQIQAVYKDALVFRDRDATKTALQQIKAPLILHLATHGFFIPAQNTGKLSQQLDNPLTRSGIILAGANRDPKSKEQSGDGILTGLEAAGLDLYGTQLVVLSACETGLGDISAGEGIYGLRRALVMAGSQTQVLSLWKVKNDATTELMKNFYQNLQAGKGRHQALREAQLKLLNSPNYTNPHYWAAFIPSGNWAPLP